MDFELFVFASISIRDWAHANAEMERSQKRLVADSYLPDDLLSGDY